MKTTADYCAAIAKALEMGPSIGPWGIDRFGQQTWVIALEEETGDVVCNPPDDDLEDSLKLWPANAAYIAACHPAAMRSILEEITQTAIAFRIKEEECERLRKDAERYRWLWNHAHNVSFTYQVNPTTKVAVMGLHCGTLQDAIDAALKDPK